MSEQKTYKWALRAARDVRHLPKTPAVEEPIEKLAARIISAEFDRLKLVEAVDLDSKHECPYVARHAPPRERKCWICGDVKAALTRASEEAE